jgi:hypothetical protein
MLWWLVGIWLASGPLIPVLWLLSTTRRGVGRSSVVSPAVRALAPRASRRPLPPNRRQMWRLMLSGLSGFAALILLFMGSFRDPITTMRLLPSTLSGAHAPAQDPLVAQPIEPTDQVALGEPRTDNAEAVPQVPPAWELMAAASVMPPGHGQPVPERARRHDRRGSVKAFVAQSNRGTWLFAPNQNSGGNS